jgi:lipoyl(octanoyl) transferase
MIEFIYLGRVDYAEGLRLQQEFVALRTAGKIDNVLLLLEHPPVLTLGRNANRANVLASDAMLAARGVTLHEINRGGDVTYHGPGQLVGYPIFDLRSLTNGRGGRLGPVDFVRGIEEALIGLCQEFAVAAGRIRGLTGVWCPAGGSLLDESRTATAGAESSPPEAKIAAIGIHVARGVTSHGFAFNVTTDLRDFMLINPCGITDRPVTSLEKELGGTRPLPALDEMARRAARRFGRVFGEEVREFESLEALRSLAQQAETDAPLFPAEDTPLRVPQEIERLRGTKEPPSLA